MNSACDDKTECDNVTALELQKIKRTLYFSDGTLEELSESEGEDVATDLTDRGVHDNIQVENLPLGPRIKYHAYLIGSRLLNGVDYIGEGLASFFGITDPKYLSESDIEYAAKGDVGTVTNDLNKISHRNEGWGWNHDNKVNSTNIEAPRFSQTATNSST